MKRLFDRLLRRRLWLFLALIALTSGLGVLGARVRPDYSVEQVFPVWDSARQVYDRFKAVFPYEDARALVVVEAPDLFTPAGLERLRALEDALRSVPDVVDVEGLLGTKDVTARGDDVVVEPLSKSPHLRETATQDALFKWNVAKPDGSAVSIRMTLAPGASRNDDGRRRFVENAEAVLAKHARPGQRLVLTGLPAIRAQFAKLIGDDVARLLPAAMIGVLLLLFVAYRSVGCVLACAVTFVVALAWTRGVMGLLGFPLTLVSSVLPIVVVIISISDTVHIVNDFTAERRAGHDVHASLVSAMAETAIPCLLTEIVLACGFLSLLAVNIVAVVQFGIAAAAAMLLTWLSNMTVLPLALSLTRKTAPHAEAPFAVRAFGRFVDWIGVQVGERPWRVVAIALLIFVAAALCAGRLRKQSYVFDGLRTTSQLYSDLRFAESAHGGLVPLAIFVEGDGPGAMLEPEAVRLLDRAAAFLRTFPEIRQANSLADYVRKIHHILAPAAGDLPATRNLVAQEVAIFDDGTLLRDLLSTDRSSAAAVGFATDAGSMRFGEVFQQVEAWVAAERKSTKLRVNATGQLKIFQDVNDTLVTGLLSSFAGAVLVSVLVFCLVLRSFRLGLIGLIPNASPIVLVLAFMALAGIDLKPGVVMAFSITLVMADDDTIQYLARFRGHFRRALDTQDADPHRTAALGCLREVGLPMFVTSSSVSLGFLLLLASRFQATAQLGLLIGATLFAAVFADLFITPILLMKIRPKIR